MQKKKYELIFFFNFYFDIPPTEGRINTYRHLSAFTVIHDVNVLIFGASASGIVGVAEATRLIYLAIAPERFVVISANLSSRIDLFVAYLDANAFGSFIVYGLKRR